MPLQNYLKHHHFCSNLDGRRYSAPDSHRVYNSVLECIGNTPLIKLNKIPREYGLECEIYAKCEFFNPAGSIKDRVGFAMMRDAEAHGVVHDDTHFVEPTSGNTGIAVSLNASLRGNPSTILTPVKNSEEKINTMRLLGSEVILIKTSQSSLKIARQIKDSDPKRVVMLDQYENDVNPRTHYEGTAAEILSALGSVDMAVMGAGTGGTMSGLAHRFKEANPRCVVVAAEPDGSTIFNKNGKSKPYLVEGLGGSSPVITLDVTVADRYEVVTDEEAFNMARNLSKTEGLLCGGSSGVAMMAAVKAAKHLNLKAGQRVVVVLADGIRNYMSKFVKDQWMEAYRFLDPPRHTMKWWQTPISELKTPDYPTVHKKTTCAEALHAMRDAGDTDLALVKDCEGNYVGVVSKDGLRYYATNPVKLPGHNSEELDFDKSPVEEYLTRNVFTLALNSKKGVPTIGLVSRVLDIAPFVVVGVDKDSDHFEAKGVAKADDVLDYIYRHSPSS